MGDMPVLFRFSHIWCHAFMNRYYYPTLSLSIAPHRMYAKRPTWHSTFRVVH